MRETTLKTPWYELALAAGGVGRLAELCGVTPRTIERWGSGTMIPHPLVRAEVRRLADELKVRSPW